MFIKEEVQKDKGFTDGSAGEETACNVGDTSLIPKLGRSAREGNGNPLQYSCLENSMDRGALQAIVEEVTESDTSTHACKESRERLPNFPSSVHISKQKKLNS